MRHFRFIWLILAIGFASTAQAESGKIFLASLTQYDDCKDSIPEPSLRSGCVKVPQIAPENRLVSADPKPQLAAPVRVINWPNPEVASGVYTIDQVTVVTRRRVVTRRCGSANCKFVSSNSKLGRQIARHVGVQASQVVGFFIPFPFSIAATTLSCAIVSTAFDASEYREDYKLEPTSDQYAESFGANVGYCSGITQLFEAKTLPQFLMAGFGLVLPFVNVPPAVGYGYTGLSYAQWGQNLTEEKKGSGRKKVKTHKYAAR